MRLHTTPELFNNLLVHTKQHLQRHINQHHHLHLHFEFNHHNNRDHNLDLLELHKHSIHLSHLKPDCDVDLRHRINHEHDMVDVSDNHVNNLHLHS